MKNQTVAKAFEDMTPAEKRVAIARDLIAHVAAGRVKPMESVWLSTRGAAEFSRRDDRQLDEVLKAVPSCICCQLGGLLYATACRANAVKVSDLCRGSYESDHGYLEYSGFSEYLERYFEKNQIVLMEMAFEGGWGHFDECDVDDDDLFDSARSFYNRHDDDEKRMLAICEILIANDGEFVLPASA